MTEKSSKNISYAYATTLLYTRPDVPTYYKIIINIKM